MEHIYDVIVVGAGAAGLLAAGRAAELGCKVLLLEKMARAGRKLMLTGKGRCNITNAAPPDEFFRHIRPNSRFLKHAFATFFCADIVRLLNDNGCATAVERGGRVFPVSNKSADVVNALMRWVLQHQVEIRYQHRVLDIVVREGRVHGVMVRAGDENRIIGTRNIILCTGGKSYPATGSDGDGYRFASSVGHAIATPRQALVPVETAGDRAQRLRGLSLKNVRAMVWIDGEQAGEAFGEMSCTAFGLAGPIILTLSRTMVDALRQHQRVELAVDLKPALDAAKLDARLIRDLTTHGKTRMDAIFRKWLPAAMIPVFLEATGVAGRKEAQQLSAGERRAILLLMKDFRFTITGCRPFKEAIITAGGVLTSEMNATTMESKLIQYLYFAGEMIDLDADTGGFNLQIAFSTAWLAAEACAMTR